MKYFCAVLCSLFAGCSLYYDVDSVTLKDLGAYDGASDMAHDASEDTAADMRGDMPDDVGQDLRDMPDAPTDMADMTVVDMPVDMPVTGKICNIAEPGVLGGACNPVQQDCPEGEICKVVLATANPLTFAGQCQEGLLDYRLAEGDACVPADQIKCSPGLYCRSGRCVRYCDLATAQGCNPEQYCARHAPDLTEVGFCTGACADGA